jgi:hypothetical protein
LVLLFFFFESNNNQFSEDYNNQDTSQLEKDFITPQLRQDILNSHKIMWIGPHADDEMYIGGILSYLIKDLHYEGIVVAFNKRKDLLLGNKKSSEFLGVDYIRIADKLYPDKEIVTWQGRSIPLLVKYWHKDGTFDELVKILKDKEPDLIFTFDPDNLDNTHSLHHPASAILVNQALMKAGLQCRHYYVLEPLLIKKKEVESKEELQATDVIELDDKLWENKLKILSFYADSYNGIKEFIENKSKQDEVVHKEFFKKAE